MADSPADTNIVVAALLYDLATVQSDRGSMWGYKRAASAIRHLDRPLEELIEPDGGLQKIPHVGQSSMRVALEVLATGASERVERLIASSPKAAEVAKKRHFRDRFLSRAEVLRVLRRRTAGGVKLADYRGDLQMHSTWSDGSEPIAALAAACVDRGYSYCAITDHSAGLPIASGVSAEAFTRQHREIDVINAECAGRFRVFKGVEANIGADGTLDVSRDEMRRFEIVLAAPHSKLRIPDDQTPRMLQAVSTPGVHILAHPRGRMFGSRAGVRADWDRVFAAAAQHDVAIEIDGDPSRQDLDFTLAARAAAAGCLIALDSDAHSGEELVHAETALAHARLAGIARDRIINCWDGARLSDWAARLTQRC